jgi:hypothetical protein
MRGPLFLEEVSILPEWNIDIIGRVLHLLSDNHVYYASNEGWIQLIKTEDISEATVVRRYISNIDAKSISHNLIYQVPSESLFVANTFDVVIQEITGTGTLPKISFGTEDDSELFISSEQLNTDLLQYKRQLWSKPVDAALQGTQFTFDIKEVSTYSSLVLTAVITGYYIPFTTIGPNIPGDSSSLIYYNIESPTPTPTPTPIPVNHQWKYCLDNANYAIYDDAHNPSDDYAFVKFGFILYKLYRSGTTINAATNPSCYVLTNGSTPNSCSDIKENWLSDNFDDNSLHCKWFYSNQDGTLSENNGVLKFYPNIGTGWKTMWLQLIWRPGTTSDISMTVDFLDFTATDGILYVSLYCGGTNETKMIQFNSNWIFTDSAGHNSPYIGPITSGKLRWRRASNICYLDYDYGPGWTNLYSWVPSVETNYASLLVQQSGITTSQQHVFLDNFTITT